MEAKLYSNLKEEEYQTLSQQLNVLAESLANKESIHNLSEPKEFNQVSREVLQFLKKLV